MRANNSGDNTKRNGFPGKIPRYLKKLKGN